MSQLLSLGAINKLTGEYIYPKIANKKDEYICPECNKDLILVQGEIRAHHFRHKVDSINPCHHYSKPTESQIHKDAKMLMKTLLENKTPIQFKRECVSCKISPEINIPEITEGSIITLEHRFNYENELKIADVAHTLNGEIKSIYEICHTHKTCSEDRPEPWVEIDAKTLIKIANNNSSTSLKLPCIRCVKCNTCVEEEQIQQEQTIKNQNKNKKYLIRSLDRENFVYLNVPFSQKDNIKLMGGKWNKQYKLWYISHNNYKKHKDELNMYAIWWVCKDCEDMEKIGEEGCCTDCWKEDVCWIDDY